DIFIDSLILSSPKELTDYEQADVEGQEFIMIEAEDVTYKNDSSIRPGALYDLDLTPYRSDRRVLNYLDSDSYKKPGHQVEYEFGVEESGYYYLGAHYRQDTKSDFPVFMNVSLDGDIPFEQFKNYPFAYQGEFAQYTLQDDEQ